MSVFKEYKVLNKQVYSFGEYLIVPIRFKDRYQIMEWRNEQIYHLRQNKPLTKKDQDKYFNEVVSTLFEQEKPEQILFSFLQKEQCIGYGGLVHVNWIDHHAEISFIMDTKLEKRCFENNWQSFLRLVEQVGFLELKLHKLFTYAFDLRPNLYTTIENAGFTKEAVLKQHVIIDGNYKDVVIHSKIYNRPWLRKASIDDLGLTFKWASNQQVRQFSFNSTAIEENEHKEWFERKINSKNCLYLILENAKMKIGSIRFDFYESNDAIISYLIDPSCHGIGYGRIILKLGLTRLKELGYASLNIIGFVKSENIASVKIFEKFDFKLTENKNNVLRFEKDLAT